VHIKNVSWEKGQDGWRWRWDQLGGGMLDWWELLRLLNELGYCGMFAMEDFRVPNNLAEAITHLKDLREEIRVLLWHMNSCPAVEPVSAPTVQRLAS
jgi:sugar phosphate isomerase/epimerase